MAKKSVTAAAIDKIIQKNLPKLTKTGVLTVRPGYEMAGHQLTGNPAIVVTVHTKEAKSELPASERLPEKIDGIPVDVREATPHQRLRAHDAAAAAVAEAYARPEEREPTWPFEREMPSGKLLGSADSEAQMVLTAQRSVLQGRDVELQAHEQKPKE